LSHKLFSSRIGAEPSIHGDPQNQAVRTITLRSFATGTPT
jgi:hypothetical protein